MKADEAKRILLVDDDETLLRVLTDFLLFEGYDVLQARDGREALRKIEERPPDILILDISMPVMGGLEVLKKLQTTGDKLRCPTLILTARSAMQGYFQGIAIDGFLAKPCSQEELISNVRRILRLRRGEQKPTGNGRPRLLLGEDDRRLAENLQEVFTEAGYELVVAETGPEVLEKAAAELPDGILLKELLPHMNGSVVASLVRTMPSTASIPVVLYDETRDRSDADHPWTVPEGITTLVGTAAAETLLESIAKVLDHERPPQAFNDMSAR